MRSTQLGTGAPRETQVAHQNLDSSYRWASFGRAGIDWMHYSDLIGAIDAPDVMPAGAMNSTQWTNGAGRPVARTNEITREER